MERLDDSPESVILESVIEGMAEYYSKNLAREVMKGLKETALQYKHTGGSPPLGYDLAEDKTYVINTDESEAVKIIFDRYIKGYPYSYTIDELNNLGYKTKKGNNFGKNSLNGILSNEKYTGVYIFNKTVRTSSNGKSRNDKKSEDQIIKVEGGVPQIIDKETFNQVRETMNQRRKSPGANKAKSTYLLSSIIRCGECGHAFQGNRRLDKYKNTYVSYRCGCRKQKRTCSNREIKKDYIEEFVLSELENHVLNDASISILSKELNNRLKKKSDSSVVEIKALESKLKKLDKEIENILNAIMNGIVNLALKEKLNELEEIKSNIELKISDLKFKTIDLEPENMVTEDQIRKMFSEFKEFVLKRNIPECKIVLLI